MWRPTTTTPPAATATAVLRLGHHHLQHYSLFLHCTALCCRPQDLQYACVTILNMNPDSPSRQTLYHTLLDLYLSPGTSSCSGDAAGAAARAAAPSSSSSGGGGGGGEPSAGGAIAAGPSGSGAAVRQGPAAAQASCSNSSSSHREALDLLKWVQQAPPALPRIALPAGPGPPPLLCPQHYPVS